MCCKSAVNRWLHICHETMNSDRYVNDILNLFFNQLTAEERQSGYFQLENTTAHMAKLIIFCLYKITVVYER
jgi:hypothetical protein